MPFEPWYAFVREIRMRLSPRPVSTQYRSASLPAVSMDSPPPLVKNTFEARVGASSATRVASSSVGRVPRSAKLENAAISRICAEAASASSMRPWPTLQYQSAPEESK